MSNNIAGRVVVTNFGQVKHLVDAAGQTFGRIDVIINNAGLMPRVSFLVCVYTPWLGLVKSGAYDIRTGT
jgi:NAD(P)-dependent dehydrogenase (short-subunit alcohol dehydrogenase family)